ncbi:MAG: trigger factor [Tissierellia bacterium]|nr:trigger factor [Tissierellia bacterium]
MSVELKTRENNKAVFTVEINPEEFRAAINKAYQKNKHLFGIPGFRKGKAPRKIIELNYGKDIFYEDAVNIVLNEKYEPALDELELTPVDYPEVDILDEVSEDEPFKAEFTVEIKPDAKLGDYSNLEVDVVKYDVNDEMVEAEIEKEIKKNARLVVVDRPAEKGDTVNIDFEGFIDGVAFDGGKGESHDLVLGSNSFIPGFEDQLVGKNAGEEFEIDIKFPEEYTDELKGKDAVFKIVMNNIKVEELPELDDDFVMDVSEFDTVEEYRNSVREKLIENNEKMLEDQKVANATKALIEITEVDIPEIMIEKETDRLFKEHENRLMSYGMNLDSYFAATHTDEDRLREDLRKTARGILERELALEAFSKAENIEATDEEIDNELRELAKAYSETEVERFVSEYKEKEDMSMITDFIINRKTLDHLVDIVKFNIKDIDPSEESEDEEVEEEKSEDADKEATEE